MNSTERLLNRISELNLDKEELIFINEIIGKKEDKLQIFESILDKLSGEKRAALSEISHLMDKVLDAASCLKLAQNKLRGAKEEEAARLFLYAARYVNGIREKYNLLRR